VLDSALSSEQRENWQLPGSAYALLACSMTFWIFEDRSRQDDDRGHPLQRAHSAGRLREVLPGARDAEKIALHFEIDAGAPSEIIGDPLRVRQIAANLLSNALKFTERGWVMPAVSSATCRMAGPMKIAVSDTGAGIEAAKLTAIFEKFTQPTQHYPQVWGTGLGLAITKRLVEMQEGNVNVESQVGKGSTSPSPCLGPPVRNPLRRRWSRKLARR